MNIKKILSVIIACIMVFVSSVSVVFAADAETAVSGVKFTDIDENTSAGKAIYKLVNAGIVDGYGDGTFLPDGKITRAELCKMVNLVYKYTEEDKEQFKDVTENEWFASQVLIAKKAGYISGYEDGTFRGQRNITRQEFCAIMCRINNYFDLKIRVKINDKVDEWATGYVNTVLANQVMVLEEDGKFRATEDITRSEVAVALASYVQEVEIKEPEKKPATGGGGDGGSSSGTVVVPPADDTTDTPSDENNTENGENTDGEEGSGDADNNGDEEGSDNNGNGTITDEEEAENNGSEDNSGEEEQKSFAQMNAEIVAKLTTVKGQLSSVRFRDKTQRNFANKVMEIINGLIADQDKYEFNYGNIFAEYQDQLLEAQGLFDTLVEEGTIKTFTETIKLEKELVDFFEEYFGIDIEI